MAGETTRDIVNEVSTIPLGVLGTGTLTQDAQVATFFTGTGTDFRTEFAKARIFIFFPETTPPIMLQVLDFTPAEKDPEGNIVGQDVLTVKDTDQLPAAGTIDGEEYQIISAILRTFGVLNKGDVDAQFDGIIGGATGTTLQVGQTDAFPAIRQGGGSPTEPKDAHWVDATGTTVEVYEQP